MARMEPDHDCCVQFDRVASLRLLLPQLPLHPQLPVSSSRGEKRVKRRSTLLEQDPGGYFDTVVERRMVKHSEARAHSATLGVIAAVDQPSNARLYHGAGAHAAGFQGHVERRVAHRA